jgi:hypothetical protein
MIMIHTVNYVMVTMYSLYLILTILPKIIYSNDKISDFSPSLYLILTI